VQFRKGEEKGPSTRPPKASVDILGSLKGKAFLISPAREKRGRRKPLEISDHLKKKKKKETTTNGGGENRFSLYQSFKESLRGGGGFVPSAPSKKGRPAQEGREKKGQ